jgi:hypothetical protein
MDQILAQIAANKAEGMDETSFNPGVVGEAETSALVSMGYKVIRGTDCGDDILNAMSMLDTVVAL